MNEIKIEVTGNSKGYLGFPNTPFVTYGSINDRGGLSVSGGKLLAAGGGNFEYDNEYTINCNDYNLIEITDAHQAMATSRQPRYTIDGKDWIDECAETLTPEEFRGAMKFTIGKYLKRMGKKDSYESELAKIADYANRWAEYERGLKDE